MTENSNHPGFYDCHIFCCTNRREPGAKRGCCAEKGAEDLRAYMKKRAGELKIPRTRINTAGCLDRCELGPVLVIYPDNVWYHYQTQADIDEILQSHVIDKKPVARLLLTNSMRLPEDRT
jgi:(2Fe-2S) ferredoxin